MFRIDGSDSQRRIGFDPDSGPVPTGTLPGHVTPLIIFPSHPITF